MYTKEEFQKERGIGCLGTKNGVLVEWSFDSRMLLCICFGRFGVWLVGDFMAWVYSLVYVVDRWLLLFDDLLVECIGTAVALVLARTDRRFMDHRGGVGHRNLGEFDFALAGLGLFPAFFSLEWPDFLIILCFVVFS